MIYSQYLQVLAQVLSFAKKNPNYLGPTITESWTRTYQVLPGRTHPMMTTSATGGYLFSATRVWVLSLLNITRADGKASGGVPSGEPFEGWEKQETQSERQVGGRGAEWR